MTSVRTGRDGADVAVITIDRPDVRNAIDGPTAAALANAVRAFEADDTASVAVLTGASGCFSAGADLRSLDTLRVEEDGDAPLGISRILVGKPVIAAVEGHAVAGGLEVALWCDMRVAAEGAVFGVFCRRFGVPLVDGGTVRLARLVGHGRAMDMVLTGWPVGATEALRFGLVDRVVPDGEALASALALAHDLAALPQACLRSDRLSVHEQWSLSTDEAMRNETRRGRAVIAGGETAAGAARFVRSSGRRGEPTG
ncbi:MAG: crotonase/enoyl-CoA hydratase family protein [Candidatus Dormibacteraeota bacterium]|nr:crotonase/enoyl-CoA hydratase family protein [Candidatus Dormibacteraeota bacterium]